MGNWSERQEAKKEVKEKEKASRETLGKFFYDLAKLVFTAMALVGGVSLIVDEPQIKQGVLLATGMLLTYIFASIGYNILKCYQNRTQQYERRHGKRRNRSYSSRRVKP